MIYFTMKEKTEPAVLVFIVFIIWAKLLSYSLSQTYIKMGLHVKML